MLSPGLGEQAGPAVVGELAGQAGVQRVFRYLSVFPGPFGLDAAEAVAGPDAGPAVLHLVDCSLLVPPAAGPDGRSRYSMLETLRGFGLRQLEQAGEGRPSSSSSTAASSRSRSRRLPTRPACRAVARRSTRDTKGPGSSPGRGRVSTGPDWRTGLPGLSGHRALSHATATMSHCCGQDRYDVTLSRLIRGGRGGRAGSARGDECCGTPGACGAVPGWQTDSERY